MGFTYGKPDWLELARGQESLYLLTNRRGSYSCASIIDSLSRSEQNLLMAAVTPPNQWVQFITKLETAVVVDGIETSLTSQEYVNHTKNQSGWKYLDAFERYPVPTWTWRYRGLKIRRRIILDHCGDRVCVWMDFVNRSGQDAEVLVRPWMRFTPKGTMPTADQTWSVGEETITSNGGTLYYGTDGILEREEARFEADLYFRDDAKDGRAATGAVHADHSLRFALPAGASGSGYVIYSRAPITQTPEAMLREELDRQASLIARAGISGELGQALVLAADQFIVDRESTGGRTIIAGYPFFGDWGRDTMIAVLGCCIATGRQEDARSIFRTFLQYQQRGIMPNMFPENGREPMYNTVDASLLFINAVYEYSEVFGDLNFVREAMPAMMEIIDWYQRGTDFHIAMAEDGLIQAGADLEQVTWMDIRIGDVLPTPRHGKPVEINAYWYNALCIMARFSERTGLGYAADYVRLSERVKTSFLKAFWNPSTHCLRDVISGTASDDQIRCNQVWALSLPFTMLEGDQARQVLDTIYTHLYTPYGLRSLSPQDPEYRPFYGGSLWDRDTAYHQGTVWAFPLGAYYLAALKVHGDTLQIRQRVLEELAQLMSTLREGCIGQIAEIFDGDGPARSKGCFAQAWSVGELLRALRTAQSD